ncbi:ABC transporter ATP-binding protein [Fimbriimonas ginsengisoli]|uniref:Sugar ABC transporter ATP-binding protein n=1 Tax=Fimbriimonas ginsengisoli Gsoil 348 TaxID=661478 RepID=A0A068NLK7_FIMGI|nr:ABC transporter ATP-binding protein [Fimbriimonas ginsengisoli]AIE83630.1 sugar ABC transporter ATP-binding protein [Fimbriimonas ginsengisoli Gsoil 348]
MKAVRLLGVTQRFGAVTALDNVDLEVESGAIHAVVGENGAGKTTLMRILYGALKPTAGQIEIDEKPVSFNDSKAALAAGIGMVSQHYGIIPELTCIQNLILGAEGAPILNDRTAIERAEQLARRMGFHFDWPRDASTLSPGDTQKLEILRLLWRNARIMILDEPTAMLSPADGAALFASMTQLASEGATVILVTHRLPEVMEYCSRVTVLRGGKRVAEKVVAETSPAELAKLIVGGDIVPHERPPAKPPGEPGLTVAGLVVRGERGEDKLKNVSLTARKGEIVGIAGVDGSGQRELFQAIAGIATPRAGSISIDGKEITDAPAAARIEAGLRVIPEDRHAEGVIESWSLEENSILGLQRLAPISKGRSLDKRERHSWAERVAARFHTRHGGLNLPMASLSGGNQQRFVAARALEFRPSLILAFQPARGLDLGGTADVYEAIRDRVEEDAAAIVVSFDLDELLEHCDRIVVMNGGLLYEPPPGKQKDREAIGRLMVGAA